MATTIALKEETKEMLEHIKEDLKAESFDETVRKLIVEIKKPKKSLFGVLKGVKEEFVREEIDRFS